jgi:hypothetical protein
MKKPQLGLLVFLAMSTATPGLVAAAFAGETHVIVATHTPAFSPIWKSEGKQSSATQPLTVEVNKGDVLQIEIQDPSMPHGFVTLDKTGTKLNTDVVQTCSENKPDALLQQIDCNVLPNDLFGKLFQGPDPHTLKLKVTEKFEDDLNFWCVKHMQIMRGIIKLKSN